MNADFGSRLDHLSNEMCQMNTRIGRIARQQSCLGGFAHSPSLETAEESSNNVDYESDDAFGSPSDDKMTISQ